MNRNVGNSETHIVGATLAAAHYKRAEASPVLRNAGKHHDAYSYPYSAQEKISMITRLLDPPVTSLRQIRQAHLSAQRES